MNCSTKNKIRLLLCWIGTKQASRELQTEAEWNALTVDEFNDFRLHVQIVDPSTGTNISVPPPYVAATPATAPATAAAELASARQELESFKRGLKRDGALYPTFRDERTWDNWHHSMMAQAQAHDVVEVLDGTYDPPDDYIHRALFDQKQSFMYSVLNRVVQTNMGKTIVRKYTDTYDAQRVYKELSAHMKKSTAAELSIAKLNEFLTLARLDSRWNGTNVGFILHWQEKMRQYEDMVPPNKTYLDGVKKRMLESAVRAIPELRQVKTNEELARATNGGISLTYTEYVNLLVSAATRRDTEVKPTSSRSKRSVNIAATDFSTRYGYDAADSFTTGYVDGGDEFFDHTTSAYGVYTASIDNYSYDDYCEDLQLIANVHERIPQDIWQTLTKEARDYFRGQMQDSINKRNGNHNDNHNNSSNNGNNSFSRNRDRDCRPPQSSMGSANRPKSYGQQPRKANVHSFGSDYDDYDYNVEAYDEAGGYSATNGDVYEDEATDN
jgi:hypothetical protein